MQKASLVHSSRLSIINLYRDQLRIFKKLGVGQRTRFGTLITDKLIDTTKKRLSQLSATYEASLTPAAMHWRLRQIHDHKISRLQNKENHIPLKGE